MSSRDSLTARLLRAMSLIAWTLGLAALVFAHAGAYWGSPLVLHPAGVADATIWHAGVDTVAAWALAAGVLATCVLVWRRAPPFRSRWAGAAVIGVAAWAFVSSSLGFGRWTVESSTGDGSVALLAHAGVGGETFALGRVARHGRLGDDFLIVQRAEWGASAYPVVVRPRSTGVRGRAQMIERGRCVYVLVGDRLLMAASDDLAQKLDVNAAEPFVLLGPGDEGEPGDVESLTLQLASPIDAGAHEQVRIEALRRSADHPNPWVRATVARILEGKAIK